MSDTKPTEIQSDEFSVNPEVVPSKEVTRSKLPDFRPLGTVRDYFTELMRQDSIR